MGTVTFIDFGRNEPLLLRTDLARALGCTVKTIENYERRGLPYELRGGKKRYKETSARNWLGSDRKAAHAG